MQVSRILIPAAFFQQVWLGSSIFLSWIVAPILFSRFGAEIGADVMGAIFPVYGWILALCSGICAAAAAIVFQSRSQYGPKASLAGLVIGSVSFLLALLQAFYVFPRSHALRLVVKGGRASGNIDAVSEQAAEMMRLHGLSMTINMGLILAAIFMFWYFQHNLRRLGR